MGNPAWVKGVSGNPKGKPRGAKTKKLTATLFNEAVERLTPKSLRQLERMAQSKAISGIEAIVIETILEVPGSRGKSLLAEVRAKFLRGHIRQRDLRDEIIERLNAEPPPKPETVVEGVDD